MQTIEVKKVIVSCIALIDDNEILIGKRSDKSKFSGFWEFPGGKIKNNETPEKGLIREIKEEIDLDLDGNCLAPLSFSTHKYDNSIYIILLYVSRKWKENPINKVHSEISWIHAKNLRKVQMLPTNNFLISSLQDLLI